MRRPAITAIWLLAVLTGAGCGGDGDDGGDDAAVAEVLSAPERPSASECAAAAKTLDTDRPPRLKPPAAGTYEYTVSGHTVDFEGKRHELPKRGEATVTPTRRAGNIICVRARLLIGDGNGGKTLIALRGDEAWTLATDVAIDGRTATLKLRRPVPVGDPNAIERTGTVEGTIESEDPDADARFTGPFVGRYATEAIGRRVMKVGGVPVKVVGVQARTSFRSEEATGVNRTTAWVSVDRRLVIAERSEGIRETAEGRARTDYSTRLVSLKPNGSR